MALNRMVMRGRHMARPLRHWSFLRRRVLGTRSRLRTRLQGLMLGRLRSRAQHVETRRAWSLQRVRASGSRRPSPRACPRSVGFARPLSLPPPSWVPPALLGEEGGECGWEHGVPGRSCNPSPYITGRARSQLGCQPATTLEVKAERSGSSDSEPWEPCRAPIPVSSDLWRTVARP